MKAIWLLLLSASVLLLASCAGGRYLRAEPFRDRGEISGRLTAIFYGGTSSSDLETAVILDMEGDGYEFVPRAPEFDYTVEKGLSPEEALHRAGYFLDWHPAFMAVYMKKVLAPDGAVIGYELRPLYRPFIHGLADVMDILYLLREDGTVSVYIRLRPEVEMDLMDNRDRGFGPDFH
jgi:hypothetical protein